MFDTIEHQTEEKALEILEANKNTIDPNWKDRCGFTFLYMATERNMVSLLEKLLSIGALFSLSSYRKNTPLHKALMLRNNVAVHLLMKYENDFSRKGHQDMSYLHCAVWGGDPALVHLILSQDGIDVNCIDKFNKSPLYYLSYHSIVQNEDSKTQKLSEEKKGDLLDIGELLLKNGADLTIGDRTGITPLHQASLFSVDFLKKIFLQKLKEQNIDPVSLKDKDHLSYIDYQTSVGNFEELRLLHTVS